MKDIPEDELKETRAALAPTLEATASILPWVAKAKPARFADELNQRWIAAWQRLREESAELHRAGPDPLRAAIFALYAIALETQDADCLALGEALASCADRCESAPPTPRVMAALAATLEALDETAGLEHEAFGERARHFAGRLSEALAAPAELGLRSPLIDHLFISEALDQVEAMREALAALPVDAYALASEAAHLAQQAEQNELWGLVHLARQLAAQIREHAQLLDEPAVHDQLVATVSKIAASINAIDS